MTRRAVARHALLIAWCAAASWPADARSLDEIRDSGVVSCGGTARPGLAMPGAAGQWRGLEPDFCRAITVALLGSSGRARFQSHGTPSDPTPPGPPEDVAFLTASEMLAQPHLERLLPGPPVFVLTQAVAVAEASPARAIADLGAALVCVEPGTGTERTLDAFIRAHAMPARLFMFQEDGERLDAFQGGRCEAIAGEAPSLAAMAANGHSMRVLPEPFAAVPVLAVTPSDDARWATVVAWTIHAVTAGEGGAPDRLPLDLTGLRLAPDWQARVTATVGTYADIFARAFGDRSRQPMSRGLTASWRDGGASVPPHTE